MIAVEVVSLLLVAALIVVIFARLGAETLRATSPGALCSHASTGNGWRRSGFACRSYCILIAALIMDGRRR